MAFGSASAVGRIGMLRPCFVQACAFGLVSAAGRGGMLRPAWCGSRPHAQKYGRKCGRNAELRENRILEEGGAGRAALSWA